jgi:hypothetical protein
MRRNIIEAVRPMKTDVQSAILALPSAGHGHTGLRAAMAKNCKIRIRASGATALVRLEVAPMSNGRENLPAYMDGEMSPWRHPVHGHRDRKWGEQPAHPFFDRTVRPRLVEVRAAVNAAVKETARSI